MFNYDFAISKSSRGVQWNVDFLHKFHCPDVRALTHRALGINVLRLGLAVRVDPTSVEKMLITGDCGDRIILPPRQNGPVLAVYARATLFDNFGCTFSWLHRNGSSRKK